MENKKTEVIVALSYGYIPDRQALPVMSVEGLEKAVYYLRQYEKLVVILTSAGFDYCEPEYEARKAVLRKLDVPDGKIFKARPSISTIDEAVAVKEVIMKEKLDVSAIGIIADKSHMRRCQFIFSKVFPDIRVWPIRTSKQLDHDNPLLPLKYRPVWRVANFAMLMLLKIFGIERFRNLAHPHPGAK